MAYCMLWGAKETHMMNQPTEKL